MIDYVPGGNRTHLEGIDSDLDIVINIGLTAFGKS